MKKNLFSHFLKGLSLSIGLFFNLQVFSQKLELDKDFWQPDGRVEAIQYDSANNRVYVGGNFTSLSPYAPFGALVHYSNARRDIRYSKPNNDVRCVVSDGKNGWFIGGDFTKVGDSARGRIVHLNSKGEVMSMFSGPGFDGSVSKLLLKDSFLFVGGDFEAYGTRTSNMVLLDTVTKNFEYNFPKSDGSITKIIPDKKGGWFVCGTFTTIGDSDRLGLAHINSSGIVDIWNPEPYGGVINDILLYGNKLYLGGSFAVVGGMIRYSLASVDATTAEGTNWNPAINTGGIIEKMFLKGKYLYVTGKFTSIGGKTRSNISAIDTATGLSSNWNPGLTGTVKAMAGVNNTLYIGGDITYIGTTYRPKLGAVDLITGKATAWNPKPDYTVNSLYLYGSEIIACGNFTQLDTAKVKYIAFFDTATGKRNSWNPKLSGGVSASFLDGNKLYVTGGFLQVDTIYRKSFAIIDLSTHKVDPWRISPTSGISIVSVSGRKVFIGGMSGTVGEFYRNGLASFNVNTGKIRSWDPDIWAYTSISDIENFNSRQILVAGVFNNIGGKKHRNLARLDIFTGKADQWDASCDSTISETQLFKGALYISGAFKKIGGQSRAKIAVLDTATAKATSWIPPVFDKNINTIALTDSIMCIGGNFTNFGISQSNGMVTLNMRTGKSIYTAFTLDYEVYCIAPIRDKIYVGGNFSIVRVIPTPFIAEIDRKIQDATTWATFPDDVVNVICPGDSDMYIGGHFSKIGGQARQNIAALDLKNGHLLDWAKNLRIQSPGVYDMQLKDSTLFVGGSFDGVYVSKDLKLRRSLLALNTRDASLLPWNTELDRYHKIEGHVNAMILKDSFIFVGGDFSDFNGVGRRGLAAINIRTGKPNSWNPDANKEVMSLLMKDSVLYVGGDFDSLGKQKRSCLGAVNIYNGALKAWNPGANLRVRALTTDGLFIYAGGDFSNVGGSARNGLARFDALSGALSSWNPATSTVRTLLVRDSFLFVGGSFSTISSQTRKYAGAFNRYTGLLTGWNPSMDVSVYSFANAGAYLMMGGSFKRVGSERQLYLAPFRNICQKSAYSSKKVTACASYSLNGESFSKTGVYVQKLKTNGGCDSFLTLDLIILDSSSGIMNINKTNCSPYVLNGVTYTKSGQYFQKLKNVMGCDSVIVLNLQMAGSFSQIKISACDSFRFNGQKYIVGGTYIHHLLNYMGCDSQITLNLMINGKASSTINASACNSYSLNGQTYKISGTYIQKKSSYLGCDSTIAINFTKINVNNNVSILGKILTADEDSAFYQWVDCAIKKNIAGETNRSFTPKVSGSFAVTVTKNGCDTTSVCHQVDITSITNTSINSLLTLFPNPADKMLSVKLSRPVDSVLTELSDMTGKILWHSIFSGDELHIDISSFAKGIYILTFETDGAIGHYRVVKE